MKSFDEYLRDAELAHGHLCAGQVLGVRLAMLGLQKLDIDDPHGKDRKRLVTFVERLNQNCDDPSHPSRYTSQFGPMSSVPK